MVDLLFSLIGFIFRNFFWIVGIAVAGIMVHRFLTRDEREAIVTKGAAIVLLVGLIAHILLYWNLSEDPSPMVVLAQCVLPAFLALMLGGGMHEVKPGFLRETAAIVIGYGVFFLVAVIFKHWIVNVISLVLGLILAGIVLTPMGKQALMDQLNRADGAFSDEVQELYREGYRPTDIYDTGKKGDKARKNLKRNGVDPWE